MYFTVELARGSPQYTFTCISTGRPVNHVLWFILYYYYGYSQSSVIGGEAVLNDSMTAQYIMTLTVTELKMKYYCLVRPLAVHSGLEIEGN